MYSHVFYSMYSCVLVPVCIRTRVFWCLCVYVLVCSGACVYMYSCVLVPVCIRTRVFWCLCLYVLVCALRTDSSDKILLFKWYISEGLSAIMYICIVSFDFMEGGWGEEEAVFHFFVFCLFVGVAV